MCGATMRMRSFCAAALRCGYRTRASLSGGLSRNIATNVTNVTSMGRGAGAIIAGKLQREQVHSRYSCRLPVAGCRLPVAGCRLPIQGHKQLATGNWQPATPHGGAMKLTINGKPHEVT